MFNFLKMTSLCVTQEKKDKCLNTDPCSHVAIFLSPANVDLLQRKRNKKKMNKLQRDTSKIYLTLYKGWCQNLLET